MKTTTVRNLDPCHEGHEVISYGCARVVMEKALSKSVNSKQGKRSSVADVEPMVDKVIVRHGSSAKGRNKESNGLVIDMHYSRLRVNRSKVKKNKLVKSSVVASKDTSSSELINLPPYSHWSTTKSSTEGHYGTWTPKRSSHPDSYEALSSPRNTESDYHLTPSQVMGSTAFSDSSPSNGSESSDVYRTRNYVTPMKQEVL